MKNLSANAGDMGLIPGLERSPGEENGNILEYSFLGNPMDRGAWRSTVRACVHAKPLHACLTLCDPIYYSPPGSSDHGNHDPGKILEWVAMPFSSGSF